ncbi:MAG: hypothetical protein NTW17_03100 [Candidatus Pacearchaeota archaeon]|nr:hypothetical protein [Candidatus Pacearchaeota archaeon]
MRQKKGQMKIQQMAFMLIAVTLFLVMAAMFILMIRFSSLKESAKLLEEENALSLVSKIADSPEFSCGSAFEKPRTNCIDLDKLMALKSRFKDYAGFWGIDGIEIRKVYPAGNEECTSENYPECGKITLVTSETGTGVSNFVSLCRKEQGELIYNKCELGKVSVVYGGGD